MTVKIKCGFCQFSAEVKILDAGEKSCMPILEHCPACGKTLNDFAVEIIHKEVKEIWE